MGPEVMAPFFDEPHDVDFAKMPGAQGISPGWAVFLPFSLEKATNRAEIQCAEVRFDCLLALS